MASAEYLAEPAAEDTKENDVAAFGNIVCTMLAGVTPVTLPNGQKFLMRRPLADVGV